MSGTLAVAAVLAAATGSASVTLTRAKISLPLRLWLAKRAERPGHGWAWLRDLLSCPFCTAVWLSFGATGIYRPWLVHLWLPLDFLVTSLAMAAGAMVAVLVITRAVTIR